MHLSLVLFFKIIVPILAVSSNKTSSMRMFGSKSATEGTFPFTVLHIYEGQKRTTCSGSLITPEWVLLAAHCVKGKEGINRHKIVAGTADVKGFFAGGKNSKRNRNTMVRRASRIVVHPQYKTKGLNADLALIKLRQQFRLSTEVRTIALPKAPMKPEKSCTITGFGIRRDSKERTLQFVSDMPALPQPMCKHKLYSDVICLGDNHRGICNGDSGGPLVCNGVLKGVASHSMRGTRRVAGNTQCGDFRNNGQYYADVYRHLKWIQGTIGRRPNLNQRKNLRQTKKRSTPDNTFKKFLNFIGSYFN